MCPHGKRPGSMNRGQEATGGAVESKASILPSGALTETCQPLHVAPDGAGIRLVLFRQRVRLGGVLLRQIESLTDCIKHRITRRTQFPGHAPQEERAIAGGIGVEGCADAIE